MKKLKAAVIGAGSSYTPELIEGFIRRRETLRFCSLDLMDIDGRRLEVMEALAKRMFRAAGMDVNVKATMELARAVDGADYVFGQVRVGGMAARIKDEKIPLEYGLVGQETTGAGGFMSAMRTVPVMMAIAEEMRKHAPESWLINFSNPSGIIAETLLNNTPVKMVGLCNNAVNMLAEARKILGRGDFEYDYVGLNHLSWLTEVLLDGESVMDKLISEMDMVADFPADLMKAIPAIPCHYLNYYYLRDKQLKKCLEAKKTRGEECEELDARLYSQYSNPELAVKPEELSLRGGALYSTAALSVADAIENDRNEYHVVNILNKSAVPFMENDDVVEVKALINKNGASPMPVKTQSPYIMGIMRAVKAYEKLTVRAALTGCRDTALAALMVHPLIGDYEKAAPIVERLE